MRMARKIKKGDVIKIKVKFNHPSFTGLGRADPDKEPSFNRAKPVTFIRNMFVYYDDELVTRFRMSSGIADDPLFTFKLKADKEAPVKWFLSIIMAKNGKHPKKLNLRDEPLFLLISLVRNKFFQG